MRDDEVTRDISNFEYYVLGKNSDFTISPNFTGVEKWFTAQAHYDSNYSKPYEHSYTDGFSYLNHGLACYTLDKAWLDVRTEVWVRGTSGWIPTWPSYWSDGSRLYYTNSRWYWRWETETVTRSYFSGYNWSSYNSYSSSYGRAYYSGSETYTISVCVPYRQAWHYVRQWHYYKRYYLHSEPYIHWRMNRVRYNQSQSPSSTLYSGIGGWIANVGQFLFGLGQSIAYSWYHPANGVKDEYKLSFPDSPVSRANLFWTQRSDGDQAAWIYHTRDEDRIRELMIDVGLKNPQIIFLEGNYSYNDRMANGPRSIFRCPVSVKKYSYVTYERKTYRCGCHHETYYVPSTHYDDYISVDLNSYDCYFTNISADTPKFSNNIVTNDFMDFISASTVYPNSNGKCRNLDLNKRERYIGYPLIYVTQEGNASVEGPFGFEGWGLLGFIPGLNTYIYDNPPFEIYSNYLQINDNNKFDRRLMDLQLKYYTFLSKGPTKVFYNGNWWTADNGVTPIMQEHYFDEGLRKAWINACTSGTFFIDEQLDLSQPNPTLRSSVQRSSAADYYYNTPFDVSIRLLYNQLLYQRSYLDEFEHLFCGHTDGTLDNESSDSVSPYIIDFDAMKLIIDGPSGNGDGMISRKVWSLATNDRIMINGEGVPSNEIYGYNQWIKIAREWFCNSPTVNAQKRKELRSMIIDRKNIYDKLINELKDDSHDYVSKSVAELSYNAYIKIKDVVTEMNEMVTKNYGLEEFFYAYLNVLYEYRRYFINKRCNKEDGTLFQMRCVESMIPMIINAQNVQEPPDPETLKGPNYKVSFYEVQNSIVDSYQSYVDKEEAKEDRIKTVYVKVEYTTEEEYKKSQQRLLNKEITEPEVVKVKYSYYEKNEDGTFKKDKTGNYIRHTPPGKFKYAKKPKNGVYRLESTEFLDYLSKVNYNNMSTNGSYKKIDEEVDEAIWEITWGLPNPEEKSELGETDILYDVYVAVDINKAANLVKDGISSPQEILCGSKMSQDYWIVNVESALPRAKGFKTDIRLVPYKAGKAKDSEIPTALCGTQTNLLFPIQEEQIYSDPGLGDITTLLKTASAKIDVDTTNIV